MSMDIGRPLSRRRRLYDDGRTISGTCNALFGLGLVEGASCRSVERCPSRWTAAGRWQMAALSVASERAKVSESRPRMRRHEGLNKKRYSSGDGRWRQTALGSSWCKRGTEVDWELPPVDGGQVQQARYVGRRRRTCPGRFILDERPCPRRPERLLHGTR